MRKGSKRTPESCREQSVRFSAWLKTPDGMQYLEDRKKFRLTEDEMRLQYITLDKSIHAIAAENGVSSTPVVAALKRYGIPTKQRERAGEASVRWKGDGASYCAFHGRVERLRGRPKQCQRCGASGDGRHYDWANLSGRYDDPDDYQRMCRSCHQKYDHQRRQEQGVKTTITTLIHPKTSKRHSPTP